MKTNDRIEKIKMEYFNFFLTLLQKIPTEDLDHSATLNALCLLREELYNGIDDYFKNFKTQGIIEVEYEIEKIRVELESKLK